MELGTLGFRDPANHRASEQVARETALELKPEAAQVHSGLS